METGRHGQTLINAMMTDDGWQAMTMLDWEEGRTYELASGTKVHIVPRDVPVAIEAALRTNGPGARRHSASSRTASTGSCSR